MPRGKKQPCAKCGTMQSSPSGLCDTCRGKTVTEPANGEKRRGRPKGSKNKDQQTPITVEGKDKCRVCGAFYGVKANGAIRKHIGKSGDSCEGSGQAPEGAVAIELRTKRGRGKARRTTPEASIASPVAIYPRVDPDPVDIIVGDRITYRGEGGKETGIVEAVSLVKTRQYLLVRFDGKTQPALLDLSSEVVENLTVEERK